MARKRRRRRRHASPAVVDGWLLRSHHSGGTARSTLGDVGAAALTERGRKAQALHTRSQGGRFSPAERQRVAATPS